MPRRFGLIDTVSAAGRAWSLQGDRASLPAGQVDVKGSSESGREPRAGRAVTEGRCKIC